MPGGKAVEVSHKTQMLNGKRYFVHIVEQGQTVYAIARAYGLKEVEAVTKKDIHFLQIGDTVWLPCKGQKLSDGTMAPSATESRVGSAHSGSSNDKGNATQAASDPEQPVGAPATIRPRVNPQSIVVSLMMPLNLSQMDKISTSKFDVEQRGKISYKSLEFIQFYEGLLLGLERLERMGYNVTLNVVDVEGTSDEAVEQAFRSHNVAQSDLLIAMLTRQPFEKAAALAREAQLFIVNPVTDRSEVVVGNPYVFKCQPSTEAMARTAARVIHRTLPGMPVYVVHSGAKAEQKAIAALKAEMDRYDDMKYTLVDWAKSSQLTTLLKGSGQSVVVSLYQQDKAKNRIYSSQLLNKLSAFKSRTPYLFTFEDWTAQYNDVDFAQLQNLNYHTYYADWDMSNPQHKAFVELFRERYKTEPTSTYAGMANDIILYFVCGIQQKGTDFFRQPAMVLPQGVLYPLSFSHQRNDWGFENQQALLYAMTDYHFHPVQ
ncbi:MAG: amino acid ABC transporter substrate-binding protein [Bacteroidales bacterium]|nr:amino acid ABC transporter substrate-binding protein [Bacteroidales bacterium]